MNKFNSSIFAVCLFSMLFLPVNAGEKIERILASENTQKVKVLNDRGNITFKISPKAEVKVKGSLDDLADDFVFEKRDSVILIGVVLNSDSAHGKNNGKGSSLEIWLPTDHDLEVKGIATDIVIGELTGSLDVDSVTGTVEVSNTSGDLKIKNTAGTIALNNVNGNIDLYSVSGEITAKINASDTKKHKLKAKTVSSNITIESEQMEKVDLFSVSGTTKLSGSFAQNADINLGNVSGRSYYFSQQPLEVNLDLRTGPDGVIENQLLSFEKKETHIDTQKQVIELESTSAKILMQTVNGRVGLKKLTEFNKIK